MPDAAPLSTDPQLITALREDLRAASYDVATCEQLLGPLAVDALRRENPIPARRVLRDRPEPAALLHRLFELGESVPASDLAPVLPTLGVKGAQQLGLIELVPSSSAASSTTGSVRALITLSAYSATDDLGQISWWIASDLSELATGRTLEGEHVLGVGGASLTLARITPRRRVSRALDLGCGGGIQAMHLSRHADEVVATDLSERALAFAAFNAALNDITLDLRQGSLTDPVAGETFDLIVSNPPFVISPQDPSAGHLDNPSGPATAEEPAAATHSTRPERWTYRDGGQPGDTLLAHLLAALPAHLAPGGTAHMLGNWEISGDDAWDAHPRTWLEPAARDGIDAWVIQREAEDPAQYAETWARDGGVTDRDPAWDDMITTWLDDFASRSVHRIGFGWIALHRPSTPRTSPGVIRTEQEAGSGSGTLAEHLLESLLALDTLARCDTDALLARRAVRADDVMERRFVVPGQWDPVRIDLIQGAGLAREVPAGQLLAATVGACDGTLTLAQIIDAVCALTDEDPAQARQDLEPQLRDLVIGGMLRL